MTDSISLEIKNLWVSRGKKAILVDVNFSVAPGQFCGIIGPNGAGKTTLLRAIVGERPAAGQVLLNGEDVYEAPEYWLRQIGYVPVDNVLHDQLTPWQALHYAGRLRLPDEPEEALHSRADALLAEFGFPAGDNRRHRPLSRLSSGERKRVNICAELLTSPPLLLLDEPTSNLDPNAELDLMRALRERAHRFGQTIVLVTHTLNTIAECDVVLFVENATIRASGDPEQLLPVLEHGAEPPARRSDFYRWAAVFDAFKTDEQARAGRAAGRQPVALAHPPSSRPIPQPPFRRQFRILLRRYFQVRRNEPLVLLLTLLLGFIGGAFLFVLPPGALVRPEDLSDINRIVTARQAVFFLSVIVSLIGLIAGFREVSKEVRIYSHERLKGLSPLAYLLSKWVWLLGAVGILAPLALLIMLAWQHQQLPDTPLPAPAVEGLSAMTLILSCTAAMTLGLAISAASLAISGSAGSDNLATILLALAVVFHVLLSGLVRNPAVEQTINSLSVLATSHWAFEGFSSGLSFYCWSSIKLFSEFNSFGHIASVWLALVTYIAIALALALLALRLRDPWATRASLLRSIAGNARPIAVFACALLVLLSWSQFLRNGSAQYDSLTFYDRDYGGIRFARIENVPGPLPIQQWFGQVNQSQCGEIDQP